MEYIKLQEIIFNHLYNRHRSDPSFLFTVRKVKTKGAEENYFTGTQKSGYFSFTLWDLPCNYRGASIEATSFIFHRISSDTCRLYFQFNMPRKPGDLKNKATAALGPEILKRSLKEGLSVNQSSPSTVMNWIKVHVGKDIPFADAGAELDILIAQIAPIVEASIKEVSKKYKSWSGNTLDETSFKNDIDRLLKRLSINKPPEPKKDKKIITKPDTNNIGYWWLNLNPSIWKIDDYPLGHEEIYTSHNAKGNKRNIYENFKNVMVGDLVIGYESTPGKRIKAILEITQGLHDDDDAGEIIRFKIKEFVPVQITFDALREDVDLKDCRVLHNNQGSLFKLESNDFEKIYSFCQASEDEVEAYTIDDADIDLFLEKEEIERIGLALKRKKNIILQGAPGVGKTFLAKRLAFLQMGKKDSSRVEMIQFHQSYSYEDFIRGFRPNEDGKFTLADGVFFEFCAKAQSDPRNSYFFIIDEINRGNLSKIFGELLMLIECDKRGPEYAVPLTYKRKGEGRFYVPENVHIIGTMNTADRSLAIVDYALRRRFAFFDIVPKYRSKFQKYLESASVSSEIAGSIVLKLNELNKMIESDKDLGAGFMIGHSYFCHTPANSNDVAKWYKDIVDQEIKPLLQEYWYDNEANITRALSDLQLN
ncbi:AAA family ATPase [Pontibacter sp. MBLB2868]|uniref:AAA family ATPase n=1 Tax=Pontibacter sp. MBLB2868 TaxID=3451555 RepID=UPI003F7502BA